MDALPPSISAQVSDAIAATHQDLGTTLTQDPRYTILLDPQTLPIYTDLILTMRY